jgi:hypothetical protein
MGPPEIFNIRSPEPEIHQEKRSFFLLVRQDKNNKNCMALPRGNFYRTPARCTAKEKERRKRNRGYQGLLAVAQQPSPPLPPSPPTHAARLLGCLGPVIRTQVPSPPPIVNRPEFSDFEKKRLKSMTASF